MRTFLRPLGWAAALLGVAAWPLPSTARPLTTVEPPAFGLIIGLRRDASTDEGAAAAERGPWASSREARRAVEVRQARVAQERTAQVVREAGLSVRGLRAAGQAQLLQFDRPLAGRGLQDAMRRARLHPDVAWVEPDVLLKRLQTVVPNDLDARQWALGAPSGAARAAINLPPAWSLTTGSPAVHTAVLDTGILPHADLVGRVLPGHDFVSELPYAADGNGRDPDPTDPGDWVTRTGNEPAIQQLVDAGLCGDFSASPNLDRSSWHGTFIAGQIGAATDNGQGIAGVTWAGKVLPVRVSGKCGALLSDLLDGMRWAAGLPVPGAPLNPTPARIINLSFGGDERCASNLAYQSAIDAVTDAGALVVVAAGNAATQLTRPADCQRVLTVGAVRQDGLKAAYSSYGPQVGLMAPGGSNEAGDTTNLYSTDNTGLTTAVPGESAYGYKNGTSFAAPWASGVAALMLSINPALTPAQLIDRLRSGVRPWASVDTPGIYPACSNALPAQGLCRCTAETCGPGLLDAGRAAQLAQGPAVVFAPLGTPAPGAVVALNGAASIAISGSSIVSYQWLQLAGPAVSLTNPGTAVATATLAAPGSYAFQLTVTDQLGRTGRDTLRVDVSAPDGGGGGGGAIGWWWGGLLWLWVVALGLARRRSPLVA